MRDENYDNCDTNMTDYNNDRSMRDDTYDASLRDGSNVYTNWYKHDRW